jgi:hypothetical protein
MDTLFSWTAVYIVAALPLLVLSLNFMFGDCVVSSHLERTRQGLHAAAMRRGRMTLVAVAGAVAWQYHSYMHRFRALYFSRSPSECNPALWLYLAADSIAARLVGDPVQSWPSGGCTALDMLYLSLVASLVLSLAMSALVSPHSTRRAATTSFCSKCLCDVQEMDHHCYFVHNCIGRANRWWFVSALASTSATSIFLVLSSFQWILSHPQPWRIADLILGEAVAALSAVGSSFLLAFQLLLLRRQWTTIIFLKDVRRRGLWPSAKSLAWGK